MEFKTTKLNPVLRQSAAAAWGCGWWGMLSIGVQTADIAAFSNNSARGSLEMTTLPELRSLAVHLQEPPDVSRVRSKPERIAQRARVYIT